MQQVVVECRARGDELPVGQQLSAEQRLHHKVELHRLDAEEGPAQLEVHRLDARSPDFLCDRGLPA